MRRILVALLLTTLALLALPSGAAQDGYALVDIEYLASGSGSWALPVGVDAVEFECMGGGGGGGSASLGTLQSGIAGGAGGGSGGYAKIWIEAPTASYAYTVGSGGAPATDGSDTTIAGMTCGGGGAGPSMLGATGAATTGIGNRGQASGGDVNAWGTGGFPGMRVGGIGWGGAGGSSFLGDGGGTRTSSNTGLAGQAPGSGGGGGASSSTTTNAGGAGADGLITIRTYAAVGFHTLVEATSEPPGGNCANGGYRLDIGEDDGEWDIRSASLVQTIDEPEQSPTATHPFLSPDRAHFYVIDSLNDEIDQYELTTPGDLTTLSYVQSLDHSAQTPRGVGLYFREDGAKMYLGDDNNLKVLRYTLSTPWDLSTATHDETGTLNAQVDAVWGIFYKPNGANLLVAVQDAGQPPRLQQYTNTAWSVVLPTYNGNTQLLQLFGESIDGIAATADGEKLLVVSPSLGEIQEYAFGTAWDARTLSLSHTLDVGTVRGVFIDEPRLRLITAGGTSINEYTYDTARDGVLQDAEVDETQYVCNGDDGANGTIGSDGLNSLIVSTPEPPGVNCAAGGFLVSSGQDDDRDGVLDAGEVDASDYVCNGEDGATGSQGDQGADGDDGFTALATTTVEDPGVNCAAGGFLVESGLDNGDGGGTARNGVLESGEVDASVYVCHGEDGATGPQGEQGPAGPQGPEGPQGPAGADGADGFTALVTTTAEPPGVNCVAGGFLVESGLDDDRDGVLEAGEVDSSDYVCHGEDGAAGTQGDQGPAGADGDDGFTALVETSPEDPGVNCAAGGILVEYGLDNGDGGGTARDGVLQAGELDGSEFVCHGEDGAAGPQGEQGAVGPQGPQGPAGAEGDDGFNTLVASTIEPAGENCDVGGLEIQSGLDNGDGGGTARNGVLESGEVDETSYVCHGEDGEAADAGFTSLVEVTPEGENEDCESGGYLVESGLDDGDPSGTARDGALQPGEIDHTAHICHGTLTDEQNHTLQTLTHETDFVEVTGLTATEFLIFPALAIAGLFLWSRKDLGIRLFGIFLVAFDLALASTFFANTGGRAWGALLVMMFVLLFMMGWMGVNLFLDIGKKRREAA